MDLAGTNISTLANNGSKTPTTRCKPTNTKKCITCLNNEQTTRCIKKIERVMLNDVQKNSHAKSNKFSKFIHEKYWFFYTAPLPSMSGLMQILCSIIDHQQQ